MLLRSIKPVAVTFILQLIFAFTALASHLVYAQDAQVAGGGDYGGGNLVNGKPIETYKVDITGLPEYKTYIEPIDRALERAVGFKNRSILRTLASRLKWYFLPVRLDQLPKQDINVFYDTEQAARQSYGEVSVDNKLYGKMLAQDKGLLLLHELIMEFYRIKFSNYSFYCETTDELRSRQSCINALVTQPDNAYRQPKNQVEFLNAAEYTQIRDAVGWLFKYYKTMTWNDLDQRFYADGFDDRFFNPALVEHDSIGMLDKDTFLNMIDVQSRTNTLPTFCGFDSKYPISSEQTCDVALNLIGDVLTVTVRPTSSQNAKDALQFQLQFPKGGLELSAKTFRSGLNVIQAELKQFTDEKEERGTVYVDDTRYSLIFLFSTSSKIPYRLDGLAILKTFERYDKHWELDGISATPADSTFANEEIKEEIDNETLNGVDEYGHPTGRGHHTAIYFSPEDNWDQLLQFVYIRNQSPIYQEELYRLKSPSFP